MLNIILPLMMSCVMSGPAHADDAQDLRKLQPLTAQEQALYANAKSAPDSLRQFIATRKYVRMVKPLVKDPANFNGKGMPPMPKTVSVTYVVDDQEWDMLWNIMLAQS
ncbi:MAG: hypothetical protein NTY77_12765 [Elusimicrobia bacterium]|nr:hypothetical protein [Elusimicrobiota bacterium]